MNITINDNDFIGLLSLSKYLITKFPELTQSRIYHYSITGRFPLPHKVAKKQIWLREEIENWTPPGRLNGCKAKGEAE